MHGEAPFLVEKYARDGFVVVKDLIPSAAIDRLTERFLDLAAELGGQKFQTPHSPEFTFSRLPTQTGLL